MLDRIKRVYQEETWEQRSQRIIPAALYSALVATIYIWTLTLVNVFSFPNLPLGIDWVSLLKNWIGLSLAAALFGAIAAWFTEEYEGIVGGGILITVLMVLFSSLFLRAQSLISVIPLIGVTMLGAWVVRWFAHRHLAIMSQEPSTRRKELMRHVGIALLVGLVPGILGRMDLPEQQALDQLHTLLQTAPNDPSVLPRLPIKRVPALKDHLGVDYRLYAKPSSVTVGAMQVTTRFGDGFTMTCLLPTGGGNLFITDCNEGDEVKLGP
jgi:hypothetical protein